MGDEVRITVIATGFGEHADDRHARPASEAAAAEGRAVRRMGAIDDDEPAVQPASWQRRGRESAATTAAQPADDGGGGEDYDVPTFLRRGADEQGTARSRRGKPRDSSPAGGRSAARCARRPADGLAET